VLHARERAYDCGIELRSGAARQLDHGLLMVARLPMRTLACAHVPLAEISGEVDGLHCYSRFSSPTNGDSVSAPMWRIASNTPGMNDSRSVESWRIVSVWPTSPKITS